MSAEALEPLGSPALPERHVGGKVQPAPHHRPHHVPLRGAHALLGHGCNVFLRHREAPTHAGHALFEGKHSQPDRQLAVGPRPERAKRTALVAVQSGCVLVVVWLRGGVLEKHVQQQQSRSGARQHFGRHSEPCRHRRMDLDRVGSRAWSDAICAMRMHWTEELLAVCFFRNPVEKIETKNHSSILFIFRHVLAFCRNSFCKLQEEMLPQSQITCVCQACRERSPEQIEQAVASRSVPQDARVDTGHSEDPQNAALFHETREKRHKSPVRVPGITREGIQKLRC
mmetsp:Transcript_33089/g.67208  ORF Transcript_33089/g.67208 Transcript_33089/m.67208 type:complete len:284 (+) Transcript_33089:150-1001(+)